MNKKPMNTHELKEAISRDIETLKTLDVDIMPARAYYQANFRLFRHVFCKIYGTVLLALIVPFLFYWRDLEGTSLETLSDLGIVAGLAFGLCVFVFLFISSSLNEYVLIKYQLRNKLETGDLIVQNIRLAGTIAYCIFAVIVLVPSIFLPPGSALFLAFGAFLISGVLTGILIEMEINRIGISTLFTLVKQYFDKDKKSALDSLQNK